MSYGSQHASVLLEEAIDALNIRPEGLYVDATFGRGGHSWAILQRLAKNGRLIALDRDLAAVRVGEGIAEPNFTIVHNSFAGLAAVLGRHGVNKVHGVLFDLGVSSPQIDEAERGFSFRLDGPLDMRMDQSHGQTAAEFLAIVSEQQLREVIKDYGEERFAKQVARAIVTVRAGGQPISTTLQLAQIVAKAIPKGEPGQNPATRTFQALRIFLNRELEELSLALPQCVDVLVPGGRLAVISFHSLEDRMVKRFIRAQQDRDVLPEKFPVRAADLPPPRMLAIGKPIRASATEVKVNPRSRSAVLRVAERTDAA